MSYLTRRVPLLARTALGDDGKRGPKPRGVRANTGEAWASVAEAAELLGLGLSTIPMAIRRGSKTKGRFWKYAEVVS